MITRFYNIHVLRQHQILHEDLWIQNEQICLPCQAADQEIDGKGLLIVPGFIDIQVNGGFGYDFSSHPESIREVARRLPQHGVTSFLPTLISLPPSQYPSCITCLQPSSAPQSAHNLGIHLEGPFISPLYRGVHPVTNLQDDLNELLTIYGTLHGVKLITLAPELPHALSAIQMLNQQGIIVSAGHTNATSEEIKHSIKAGLKMVTHVFNAMRPFHHREPGVIGEALTNPSLSYSIIADKQHVHSITLNIAYKCHSKDLILTTDAVAALGCPSGTFTLGPLTIAIKDNQAVLPESNQLAGGMTSLDECLRRFIASTNCPLIDALEAVSLRPAKLLGIPSKGHLNPGADADFVLLDHQLRVKACYVAGQHYQPPSF